MASSKVDINTSNSNKKESEVAILSILEKSYYNKDIPEENFYIPEKFLKVEIVNNNSNNNITLFNALYNSLINKDHKSFLFCIQQNNQILIEETVKQMNNDCLEKFIEKSLDIFQSNSLYSKNILPWMRSIFKFKKFNILTKNNIENLIKIKMFINDKIKCFNNLCLLKQKMNKINEIFCPKNEENSQSFLKISKNEEEKNDSNDNRPVIFEPLLTYYESEDEEEAKENKKKKEKMEIEGFEEIESSENNEEDEEMEEENIKEQSEEDDLDEEIDNMDNEDKIKNKKNINKEKNEGLSEEEEENEDDEEDNE